MDFCINNETFAAAYLCLKDANVLLKKGLGNFNELDQSALQLISQSDIKNSDVLAVMNDDCQYLENIMYKTINFLSEINVESALYFDFIFSNYVSDVSLSAEVIDYGSEEHLDFVRKWAKKGRNYGGPGGCSETWCPLEVTTIVKKLGDEYGYSNLNDSVREDGVRILSGVDPDGNEFKDLVIVAADVIHDGDNPNGTFERGEIVDTTFAKGIVVDYCQESVDIRKQSGRVHFDIYTTWAGEFSSVIYGDN